MTTWSASSWPASDSRLVTVAPDVGGDPVGGIPGLQHTMTADPASVWTQRPQSSLRTQG
jgi:hypothetical protein